MVLQKPETPLHGKKVPLQVLAASLQGEGPPLRGIERRFLCGEMNSAWSGFPEAVEIRATYRAPDALDSRAHELRHRSC